MASLALLLVALFPLAYFLTWSAISSSTVTASFPILRNKRICLLIAHPDDEAMFFAPTVQALTKPELGNHVKILCLSSGDADGLGHIRKKELQLSAVHLGLRDPSDVFVIDDPSRFPDSMSKTWPESSISELLTSAFVPTGMNAKNASTPAEATIDTIITFDEGGISNHPNHISLYHGAKTFLANLAKKGAEGGQSPVTMYTLSSTPIYRKYAGIWDAPITVALDALDARSHGHLGAAKDGSEILRPRALVFVSGMKAYWEGARKAMVEGHKSQMVWFRWGWITLGRYMVVNDLKRVDVS